MGKKVEMVARDMDIERDGRSIVLPADPRISLQEAVEWLHRKIREQEEEVAIKESINASPADGAVALSKAMKELYGWTSMERTSGFFGSNPPSMLSVEVGYNKTIQVPWGRFSIPGVDGYIQTGLEKKNDQLIFQLQGVVKQKHAHQVRQLAELTRKIVREDSIYKGKAFRLDYRKENEFGFNGVIEFIDLSNVRPNELVFSRDLERQLEISLFQPILMLEECRTLGVPTKRTVLLHGSYGTGKTMAAMVAARHCEDSGRTFVYLQNADQLAEAIQFARQYEPSTIFLEDVDQVVSGDRDDRLNEILNTIDGLDTKDAELLVVLTSNHANKINAAMRRHGRLDDVIHVTPPDAEAVERLIRIYSRDLLADETDLTEIGEVMAGLNPASIRELCERAKLAALNRTGSTEGLELIEQDLLDVSKSIRDQVRFMEAEPSKVGATDRLLAVLGHGLGRAIAQAARFDIVSKDEAEDLQSSVVNNGSILDSQVEARL